MPYWRLFYHLVWATKRREPLIDDAIEAEIRWSIRATALENRTILHAVGVMPDHVHVAVSIPPGKAVGAVIGQLKGASAHKVNHRPGGAPATFVWQEDYGALSFGERTLRQVVAYVEHQRERHAARDIWPALERCAAEDGESP